MRNIGSKPLFSLKYHFQLFQHPVKGLCQMVDFIFTFFLLLCQPYSFGQICIRLDLPDRVCHFFYREQCPFRKLITQKCCCQCEKREQDHCKPHRNLKAFFCIIDGRHPPHINILPVFQPIQHIIQIPFLLILFDLTHSSIFKPIGILDSIRNFSV